VLQLFCEEVVLIPVLLNSWVREPRQNSRARTGIIGGQDWFPQRKNTDVRIWVLF
jgi:hypothetical protein